MRGRVCSLQLLLGLTSTVILRFDSSRGLMTIFYCLKFGTPPTWRAGPIFIAPRTGWPSNPVTHPVGKGSYRIISFDSQYVALGQIPHKTQLPALLLLLESCELAAMKACLQSHSITSDISSGSPFKAFNRHVTLLFIPIIHIQ
jgi:hypothetical protein